MNQTDEYGIPKGAHTLTCGCKAKGRAIVEPCSEHRDILRPDAEIMSLPTSPTSARPKPTPTRRRRARAGR